MRPPRSDRPLAAVRAAAGRVEAFLAAVSATVLIVVTVVGLFVPLIHFGVVYGERLGEWAGWIPPGWLNGHGAVLWWVDGSAALLLALGFGIPLFPRIAAADAELDRPEPPSQPG